MISFFKKKTLNIKEERHAVYVQVCTRIDFYLIKRESIYECDKSKRKSVRRVRFISLTPSTFRVSYILFNYESQE